MNNNSHPSTYIKTIDTIINNYTWFQKQHGTKTSARKKIKLLTTQLNNIDTQTETEYIYPEIIEEHSIYQKQMWKLNQKKYNQGIKSQ